jgi:uncharacterized UPF0160 family protein
LNDLYEKFYEKVDLLENIKNYYSNNKKLCDVINSIFNIFNPSTSSKTKHVTAGAVNLLGDEFGRDSVNNTNSNGKINLFV